MKNLMLKVSNPIFKRAFFSLQGSSFFKTIIREFRDLYLVATCGEQFLLLIVQWWILVHKTALRK